jgi:hypothetical protein
VPLAGRASIATALVIAAVCDSGRARAAAGASWTDTPALVARATAPVEDALRACVGARTPRAIELVASRGRGGATRVSMPLPQLGHRGPTAEERCLTRTIARVRLPPLPPLVERLALLHVIVARGAPAPAADPAFVAWRDPGAAVAALLAHGRRAALAACDRGPRTIRLILDLRRGATRVWLPAWQFHSPTGDGTTPPAQRRVRACLRAAIPTWRPPLLPRAMGELEVAIPVTPARRP